MAWAPCEHRPSGPAPALQIRWHGLPEDGIESVASVGGHQGAKREGILHFAGAFARALNPHESGVNGLSTAALGGGKGAKEGGHMGGALGDVALVLDLAQHCAESRRMLWVTIEILQHLEMLQHPNRSTVHAAEPIPGNLAAVNASWIPFWRKSRAFGKRVVQRFDPGSKRRGYLAVGDPPQGEGGLEPKPWPSAPLREQEGPQGSPGRGSNGQDLAEGFDQGSAIDRALDGFCDGGSGIHPQSLRQGGVNLAGEHEEGLNRQLRRKRSRFHTQCEHACDVHRQSGGDRRQDGGRDGFGHREQPMVIGVAHARLRRPTDNANSVPNAHRSGGGHAKVDPAEVLVGQGGVHVQLHRREAEPLNPLLTPVVGDWRDDEARLADGELRARRKVGGGQVKGEKEVIAVQFKGLAICHHLGKVGAGGGELVALAIPLVAGPAVSWHASIRGEHHSRGAGSLTIGPSSHEVIDGSVVARSGRKASECGEQRLSVEVGAAVPPQPLKDERLGVHDLGGEQLSFGGVHRQSSARGVVRTSRT